MLGFLIWGFEKNWGVPGFSGKSREIHPKCPGRQTLQVSMYGVRATVITTLSADGVSDRDFMAITGHRNAQSLSSYSRPSNKLQQSVASTLDQIPMVSELAGPFIPSLPEMTAAILDLVFNDIVQPETAVARALPPLDYDIDQLLSTCTAQDFAALKSPAFLFAPPPPPPAPTFLSSINLAGAILAGAHFSININK